MISFWIEILGLAASVLVLATPATKKPYAIIMRARAEPK